MASRHAHGCHVSDPSSTAVVRFTYQDVNQTAEKGPS
jgi:hypothetical protein